MIRQVFIAALLVSAFASAALCQEYPSRPVRMIVGFTPGGGADTIARVAGAKLAERLKQPVVIDNRPGAGGMVGTALVAKSAPDGYSLLLSNASFATNPVLYEKTATYDPIKDFAPVYQLGASQYLLTITPSLPANSVKDLVALARARPGKLNVASAGLGGPGHLAAELFQLLTGTKIAHVPYKGTGPIVTSMLSAETQMVFGNMGAMVPLVHAQRLKGLAVSGAARSTMAPEFPTMAEAGIAGFEVSSWYGVLAPAGTPASIINRLHKELVQVMDMRDVKEKLTAAGLEITGASPERFRDYINAEIPKWKKVIKASGIRLD